MSAVSAACRRALLEADPRLVEAMYLCQVQAAAEALSGVYASLGRRRARILAEEMREGSGAFLVHAYLPVEASFGLADEMRRKTSGAASASLMLSHWERLQVGAREGGGGAGRSAADGWAGAAAGRLVNSVGHQGCGCYMGCCMGRVYANSFCLACSPSHHHL